MKLTKEDIQSAYWSKRDQYLNSRKNKGCFSCRYCFTSHDEDGRLESTCYEAGNDHPERCWGSCNNWASSGKYPLDEKTAEKEAEEYYKKYRREHK